MNAPHAWIEALAGKPMQTPSFVYSMDGIAQQMRRLQQELGTPILAVVSACSNPDVLARLPEDVRFGARCASRFEMNVVSAWASEHLYVGIPSMDALAARAVLGGRYRFVAEAPTQIETLVQLRGARKIMPITLSLSNQLAGGTGLRAMDAAGFEEALGIAQRHDVPVGGLHMHAGRHGFGAHGLNVARTLRQFAAQAEARLGYPLQTVNLGGGLEEDWWMRGHDFVAYRNALAQFPSHLQLMHELGRSIFASAGAFLTRVVAACRASHGAIAVCDGGLAQAFELTMASPHWREVLPLVHRQGVILPTSGAQPRTAAATAILGASATDEDVFAWCAETLQPDDVLVFPGTGAYMQQRSPSGFMGHAEAGAYVGT